MKKTFYQEDYRNDELPFRAKLSHKQPSFLWHWHEEFEILVGMKKEFIVGIDNQFYTMKEKDIIIVKSNEPHCILAPDFSQHLTVKFSPIMLKCCSSDFTQFLLQDLNGNNWDEKDKENIWKLVMEMWRVSDEKDTGYCSIIYKLLFEFQYYCIRHLPVMNVPEKSEHIPDAVIRKILVYLSEHYKESLSLPACAAHFGFNPNYFSSLFSSAVGINFKKYLQILRLREFEHLLLLSKESVTECCARAGFQSIETLNRVFKAEWGMTPTEYRKKYSMNK